VPSKPRAGKAPAPTVDQLRRGIGDMECFRRCMETIDREECAERLIVVSCLCDCHAVRQLVAQHIKRVSVTPVATGKVRKHK